MRLMGGALLLGLLVTAGCRQAPPGDSGGAASGDRLTGGIGSARSNDSFEQARPSDTMPAAQVHDERGADTSAR